MRSSNTPQRLSGRALIRKALWFKISRSVDLRARAMRLFAILTATLLLAAAVSAQRPTVVPQQRPNLKRDRTQRVLYPKIIQHEDERVVAEELLDMLNLSHGGARRRAILALGRIGNPVAVPHLVEILGGDRNPQIRALAAFSLGEIESHMAAQALLERIEDKNEDSLVKARAAEALGKIASNRYSAEALGQYGVKMIAEAIARLLPEAPRQPSQEEKLLIRLALTALIRLKQPSSVAAIAAQLKSPDPDVCWQAANALARIGEFGGAMPSLIRLLGSNHPLVRAHVARALGVARERAAVEPLIKLLSDADQRVAANAVVSLGMIGDRRAAGPLLALGQKLLSDYRSYEAKEGDWPPEQNLLLLITTALGQLRDPQALDFLKTVRLIRGHAGSSPEAEIAMARFSQEAFFDLSEVKLPNWEAVAAYAQGLGQLGTERARAALLDLLGSKPDPRAVPHILRALAATKPKDLRELLLEQLSAKDVIVRATAADLLGELGDSSDVVIEALKRALAAARSDQMNDARIAIIEAADRLGRPLNVQVLSGPTRDPDYVVRARAYELLRRSGSEIRLADFQVGKVQTGHDRAYWRRIAQLMLSPKNPIAVIHTPKGTIRLELFASDAPMTVYNFIELARRGFYDGLSFMRVVPNFVIQGGDPRNDMNGGPGYQIRCEINLRQFETGSVGMALSGKDTGGSQFFITLWPQPHLDGGYTLFGQVIGGMEVVSRIARGDRIDRVEIIGDLPQPGGQPMWRPPSR